MNTLQDKIAIITGGGQGLGEALAHRLADEGAPRRRRRYQRAKRAKGRCGHRGQRSSLSGPMRVDVTKEDQVESLVAQTVAAFGRLDILVANAGILKAFEVTEFPADAWRLVIEVNLTDYFLCARARGESDERAKERRDYPDQ